MQSRMKNPAMLIPGAMKALMALNTVVRTSGVPATVAELVHLRVSQINGCSVCVDMGWRQLKKAGETDLRLSTVCVWREAPYFSGAERAALALAEEATRIADRPDAVPDEVWEEAARYFSEEKLAGITMTIGLTNFWNRLNFTTPQISGEWVEAAVEQVEKELLAAAD